MTILQEQLRSISTTVTTAEAATILAMRGFTRTGGRAIQSCDVQRWCWLGRIPNAYKHGGTWRGDWCIPRETIAKWIPPKKGRPKKAKMTVGGTG